MIVNFFTETKFVGLETTGIVTAYKKLAQALRDRGIKVKVNAGSDYDLLHIHSFGPISLAKAAIENKPVVITSHTMPEEVGYLYKGGRHFVRLSEWYMRHFYNQADLVLSPSDFAKKRLREIGVEGKITVQSNGIDVRGFEKSEKKAKKFREKYEIPEDEVVIGCVGLVSKRKGLDVFKKLAEQMPEFRFVWVGKNVYGRWLRDYSYVEDLKEDHPDNLTLTGYVEDIQAAYSAMDLFVFPTRIETEGLVILEAACFDLPIITSKVEGLSWCEEGRHCLKAEEIEDYIEKIRLLLSNNERREKLVSNSKELIKEKRLPKVAKEVTEYYKELLNENSNGRDNKED